MIRSASSTDVALDEEARAMLAGELGQPRRWAIEHQLAVARFFGAPDLVRVSQAHIMADTESLGEAGVAFLERLAGAPEAERRVAVPTITDPRGTDFAHAERLGQTPAMLELERRTIEAFRAMGVLLTDTCINYQTIMGPLPGEHVAYGDTGVVIYCNSVLGARSNFEGGPSAVAAGLTGRTPRYGFHLDERRRPTLEVRCGCTPASLDEWGALGGIVGQIAGDYWQVPLVTGLERAPRPDEVKHFGAAAASFGSLAMFQMEGVTRNEPAAAPGSLPRREVGAAEIAAFRSRYRKAGPIDVVVFSAPQLSLVEMAEVADLCAGRRLVKPLIAVTSPQVKPDADRLGLTARIEESGGMVLSGMCFYQSYAREIGLANGWRRLATNSTKLVNILGGYGYEPLLASLEECVMAAETGELP
jgi:predicted aconitase